MIGSTAVSLYGLGVGTRHGALGTVATHGAFERNEARDAAHEAGWPTWLAELEQIMREWDAKHGNLPYSMPLTNDDNDGNRCCWKDSYDDGMTPREAFVEP